MQQLLLLAVSSASVLIASTLLQPSRPQSAATASAPARIVFVDVNNPAAADKNPGTEALPYKTIQRAAQLARAGTTVYVKAGTYTDYTRGDCVFINHHDATAAAPIIISAYKQPSGAYDKVVIKGVSPSKAPQYGLRIADSSYIIIDGFEFTSLGSTGVSLGRGFWDGTDLIKSPVHHITIRNCVVHDNGRVNTWNGGFEVVGPSHDIVFERCESYANGRGFFFGTSHETNQKILPHHITVRYCLAHHNALYGNNSDGFTTAGASNVLISHCVSHDNTADQFTEEGPWCDNNVWEWCVGFNGNSQNNPEGDGNGFKVGNINPGQAKQFHGSLNHIVRHCISFNNRNRGFEDTEGALNTQFYNNVAFGNNYWGWLTEGKGAILRNNVGQRNAVRVKYQEIFGDAALSGATVAQADYNFWSDLAGHGAFKSAHKTSYDGKVIEPHSIAGDPQFVSTSPVCDTRIWSGDPAQRIPNPMFGDVAALHLQAGSPCIGAGTPITESGAQPNGRHMGVYSPP